MPTYIVTRTAIDTLEVVADSPEAAQEIALQATEFLQVNTLWDVEQIGDGNA